MPPALRAASDKPNPDAMETEHSPIIEGVARPATAGDAPSEPARPLPPDLARTLMEIEVAGGHSPADARARMNETAAVREAAEEADAMLLVADSPDALRGRIDALAVAMEQITPQPAAMPQAAE